MKIHVEKLDKICIQPQLLLWMFSIHHHFIFYKIL
ncbi:hypothetical protein U14_01599 [Candidatus Moduliflexus flocculans]|uniref:Uncharacterized protein n=1 Tax=Candidatus Moduliflexus flocculans TaxID=1499966 RepID=A0A0S6VXY6_9BACT|nr:hypothetical protein U14_01599 [Candidatus Moduliflexus flocculans]